MRILIWREMERQRLSDTERCVDEVIRWVGKTITLGLPLGLGKPVRLVNALYQRAKDDPEINLDIFTALSRPAPNRGIFFGVALYGAVCGAFIYGDIPDLQYARDVAKIRLPPNVQVS